MITQHYEEENQQAPFQQPDPQSEQPEQTPDEVTVTPDDTPVEQPEQTKDDAPATPDDALVEQPEQANDKASAMQDDTPVHWEDIHFPGKEYCLLTDNGEIALKATPFTAERVLPAITLTNYESVGPVLSEKFGEAGEKLRELEAEWKETDDILKLSGKFMRLKDYLSQINAIGDFAPLFAAVAQMENAIREQSEANYAIKAAIVAQAETLKDSEDWRVATEGFKELVDAWKNAPLIEKEKNEALWQQIETARNHFYERKRQHHEDMEKEMMQNLDLKMELCEQAEAMADSEEWRKTSEKMKDLFEEWKKIGRVATHEKNEELWNRFITARNVFFDRKKQHYELIQQEQEVNYQLKLAITEKAEALQDSTDWKIATDTFAELMEQWKKTGRVPAEKSDELWARLQAARDRFFGNKRQHHAAVRITMEDNFTQKSALVSRAEQIMNSTDWRATTDELNELMTEWKKIGYINRAQGDELWSRFIGARKHFFDRKDADREKRKSRFQSQFQSRLNQTRDFFNKIAGALKEEEDKLEDFKQSLANTTGEGQKEDQLREHLKNLIAQTEQKLPEQRAKVKEVEAQLAELEHKKPGADHKDKPEK